MLISQNICNGYNLWSKSTVCKILHNSTYIGDVIGHTTTTINYKTRKRKRVPKDEWVIVHNMHEPIISKQQYELAQKILKEHGTVRTRKHDNIFKRHRSLSVAALLT